MASFDTLSAETAANILRDYTALVDEQTKVKVEIDGRVRTVDTRPIYSFEQDILEDVIDTSITGFLTGASIPVKGRWIHGWLQVQGASGRGQERDSEFEDPDGDYINNIWHNYQFFLRYLQAETEDIQNMGTFNKSPGTYDSMYRYILLLEDLDLVLRYKEISVDQDEYDSFVPENIRKRTFVRNLESYEEFNNLWDNPIEALYGDEEIEEQPDGQPDNQIDEIIDGEDEILDDEDEGSEGPEFDDAGLIKIDSSQKLSEQQQRKIAYLYTHNEENRKNYTQRELAEKFLVSQYTISNIVNEYGRLQQQYNQSHQILEDDLETRYAGEEISFPSESEIPQDSDGDLEDVEEEIDDDVDEDDEEPIPTPEFDISEPASIIEFNEDIIDKLGEDVLISKYVEGEFPEACREALKNGIIAMSTDSYSLDGTDNLYYPSGFELKEIAVVEDWAEGTATPGKTELSLFIGIEITSDGQNLPAIPPAIQRSLGGQLGKNNFYINAFPEYNVDAVYTDGYKYQLRQYIEANQDENVYYDYRELEMVNLSD